MTAKSSLMFHSAIRLIKSIKALHSEPHCSLLPKTIKQTSKSRMKESKFILITSAMPYLLVYLFHVVPSSENSRKNSMTYSSLPRRPWEWSLVMMYCFPRSICSHSLAFWILGVQAPVRRDEIKNQSFSQGEQSHSTLYEQESILNKCTAEINVVQVKLCSLYSL